MYKMIDAECPCCGKRQEVLVHAGTADAMCEKCGAVGLKRIYISAPSFKFKSDYSPGVLSNPVLRGEVLGGDNTEGYSVLSTDERKEIAKTLVTKGDSPQLRRDVESLRQSRINNPRGSRPIKKT